MAKVGVQTAFGVVIAIVIALGIGLGVTYLPSGSGTGPTTSSQTSNSQSKATTTTTWTNSTTSQSLSLPCSMPPPNNATFYDNENSNLILCVRFYYYSSSSPISVAPTDQLSIGAYSGGGILTSPPNSTMSNFTVTAQPSNFSIGGSSNENEGILVEYDIHSLANSNGSYILNLGWLAPQIRNCWSEFELIVGNGTPNYYAYSTCQTFTESGTGSSSSNYPSGILFAEVVGSGHPSI